MANRVVVTDFASLYPDWVLPTFPPEKFTQGGNPYKKLGIGKYKKKSPLYYAADYIYDSSGSMSMDIETQSHNGVQVVTTIRNVMSPVNNLKDAIKIVQDRKIIKI